MEFYKINKKKSLEISENNSDFEAKSCYNNVFYAMYHDDALIKQLDEGFIRVVYGYLKIFKNENVLVRHCFFIDQNGEVIDPTLRFLNLEHEELLYVEFKSFRDYTSYHEAISNDTADLIQTFKDEESRFILDCAELNYYCLR